MATRSPRASTRRKKAAPAPAEVEPEVSSEQPAETPPSAFIPPEVEFAARVPEPEPERARPARRRGIFVDVENASRASRIEAVLGALGIDRTSARVDLVASGNWRVIGNETARLLASKGAQLMHSA